MCLTGESIFLTTASLGSGKCRTFLATLPVLRNGEIYQITAYKILCGV